MSTVLSLLSAGAAQGLVRAVQATFESREAATLQARYGAVGAMKEALFAGEPCDVLIVTERMVGDLVAEGRLRAAPIGALGRVRTGVAVRAGEARPPIETPEALRAALLAATAIYFPDPERATAGIHFAKVLATLGVHDALQDRLRTFPNGATAMREMATGPAGSIGCTQVSEILYTPGVALVGALPQAFELSTPYTAAVSARAVQPQLAAAFIAHLTDAATAPARRDAGFDA